MDTVQSHAAVQLCNNNSRCPSSLLSQLTSSIGPIPESMNFLANALGTRPSSTKVPTSEDDDTSSIDPAASLASLEKDGVDSKSVGLHSTTIKLQTGTTSRTKTSFQLRYPPPTAKRKQRLNIRPKLLLQLHRVCQASRPKPTYDVLPSVIFAPRLARKFPNTFKARGGLGVNDLVVVNSEDYSEAVEEEDHSDDLLEHDRWKSRDIIAAICQLESAANSGDKRAEICFSRRGTWIASLHPKGGFEFVFTDQEGKRKVARWIPRRKPLRKQHSDPLTMSTSEKQAFNFSLLDPASRRHAVIATMDSQSIDVVDSYSKPFSDPPQGSSSSIESTPSMEVTEELRTLIVVSGIWVAWCEGFLPSNGYRDSMPAGPESPRNLPGTSHRGRRSASLTLSQEERDTVFEESSSITSTRPALQPADSAATLPSRPTSTDSSVVPRRTQSLHTRPFTRPSSSRQDAIWEDASTLAESDSYSERTHDSNPAESFGEGQTPDEEEHVDDLPQVFSGKGKKKFRMFGRRFGR